MKKDFLKFLMIFGLCMGSAQAAQWAGVFTPTYGTAVQCNNWGWVTTNYYTVWPNACTPLQARSSTGEVYTVDTTDGVCGNNAIAVYRFNDHDDHIEFVGCRGVRGAHNQARS